MLVFTTSVLIAAAQVAPTSPLAGNWTVDLASDPAKPYTKQMTLRLAADGTVSGSFYDSDIQAGRWKTDRGRTCASFRTTDGAGPYHSSVCLQADRAIGQTWAEHRNFLFNWIAQRR
jgi:hypothetical protein